MVNMTYLVGASENLLSLFLFGEGLRAVARSPFFLLIPNLNNFVTKKNFSKNFQKFPKIT
jgi:hypothetical protein